MYFQIPKFCVKKMSNVYLIVPLAILKQLIDSLNSVSISIESLSICSVFTKYLLDFYYVIS